MFVQKAILNFEKNIETLFVRTRNDEMSFDTFFNSLNLYLIKHYTDGRKLKIKLDYSGDASVQVAHAYKKEHSVLFESERLQNEIEIDLSSIDELGIIYPVFKGTFTLKSLTYEVDAPNDNISATVIFTTYNRQEFLIPNLYKLNQCELVDRVVVIDNAKNVKLPDDLSKDKFIVVPNENLGGTGGFTRGMMKAKEIGSSHIFIMDDDITLLPEVVDKALSLISCLNENHKNDWLGFSMLPNGRPALQYELGTKWNGIKMLLNNHYMDMSKVESLYKNQVNTKYNYSAWWSLVMPMSVVDRHNYPFPFFIKFDDIEYGLRRDKEEIILTNGFAVWHEDFDKKYNPYLEYYLYRNALVTNALHDKKPLLHSFVRFFGKNVKAYFKFQHIEMKLMNIAVDDYLKGPDYFLNLDIAKRNNEIREIAKQKVNPLRGIFINPFITIFYLCKILFKFNKPKKLYKDSMSQLTSESYWKKVFNNGE